MTYALVAGCGDGVPREDALRCARQSLSANVKVRAFFRGEDSAAIAGGPPDRETVSYANSEAHANARGVLERFWLIDTGSAGEEALLQYPWDLTEAGRRFVRSFGEALPGAPVFVWLADRFAITEETPPPYFCFDAPKSIAAVNSIEGLVTPGLSPGALRVYER